MLPSTSKNQPNLKPIPMAAQMWMQCLTIYTATQPHRDLVWPTPIVTLSLACKVSTTPN